MRHDAELYDSLLEGSGGPLRRIIDALCIGEAHLVLDEKARATCETARAMGADTSKILSRVYQQLASKYAAEIDGNLTPGQALQARQSAVGT